MLNGTLSDGGNDPARTQRSDKGIGACINSEMCKGPVFHIDSILGTEVHGESFLHHLPGKINYPRYSEASWKSTVYHNQEVYKAEKKMH